MRQDASFTAIAKNTINDRSSTIDLFVNYTFDTNGKNVFLVFTTNGTAPSKSNGTIISCSFSNYSEPNRTFIGSIPSTSFSAGNNLKYLFYISDSDLSNSWGRVAGNSGYGTSWTEGDDYFECVIKYANSSSGGNWSNTATWFSENVPNSSSIDVELIPSTSSVILNQDAIISSLSIISSVSFIASDATPRTLTISKSSGGSQSTLVNEGTWSNGTGGSTVVLTGAPSSGDAVHEISGTITFENVTVNKTGGSSNVGASFGEGSAVSGTLRIGAGGFISTNPPSSFYGLDATLDFNQGASATYDVNSGDKTWSTTEVPNNITITSGTVVLNDARSFSGLLQVQNGATLKTNGNLTLKSDENASASILNSGAITGDITFQRYLTNYTLQTDAKYHFISSPVLSQAIQPEFVADPPAADVDFYKFDEASNVWINTKFGTDPNFTWNPDFETNFAVGRGYLVAYPTEPVTKSFTGELNDNASYVLNCTYSVGKGEGWNLIGNPYPAAIDWNAVTSNGLSNVDNALYYYDAAVSKYRYYIKLSADDPTSALGDGSRYIPSGQGFMVHAQSGENTKTVTIEKADLTHSGQNVFYKSTTNLVSGSLSLKVTGNGHEDQTFIHFNENASIKFDGSYDAYKLKSTNPIIPMIYTTNESGVEFAINGLPKIQEGTTIPLALQIGEAGEYTIQAMVNDVETNLFLEDLFTGESTKLSENPTYSFTSSSTDSPDRFLLHFGVVGIGEQDQATTLNAYAYNNSLYVNNSLEQAQIAVYDLQGRLLMQQSANTSGLQSLPLDLPTGVYVVRLSNSQEAKSVKINVQ